MCTDAYREALTRQLSSRALASASSQHEAAEVDREGIVGRPLQCPETGRSGRPRCRDHRCGSQRGQVMELVEATVVSGQAVYFLGLLEPSRDDPADAGFHEAWGAAPIMQAHRVARDCPSGLPAAPGGSQPNIVLWSSAGTCGTR